MAQVSASGWLVRWGFYDRYGRGIAKWESHDMQDRSRSSSISGQQGMRQHAKCARAFS